MQNDQRNRATALKGVFAWNMNKNDRLDFGTDFSKISSWGMEGRIMFKFSMIGYKNLRKVDYSYGREVKDTTDLGIIKLQPTALMLQEVKVTAKMPRITMVGDLKRVIVFSGSKFKVKQLAASLQQIGVNCGAMHSDLEQAERDDVMFKFKSGQYDVLVACNNFCLNKRM